MKKNFINQKFVTMTLLDVLLLTKYGKKINDEELLIKCNDLYIYLESIKKENNSLKVKNFALDSESALGSYFIQKYEEFAAYDGLSLPIEFFDETDVVNALNYAKSNNDAEKQSILEEILKDESYNDIKFLKSMYNNEIAEYIRLHAFYNQELGQDSYPCNDILIDEDENGLKYSMVSYIDDNLSRK